MLGLAFQTEIHFDFLFEFHDEDSEGDFLGVLVDGVALGLFEGLSEDEVGVDGDCLALEALAVLGQRIIQV